MPRMHVWLMGVATATAVSYIGFHHVYLPRATTQREFERKLIVDNQQLQHVMQTYAQLKVAVEQARTRSAMLARQPQRPHGGGGEGRSAVKEASAKDAKDPIDYETLIVGGSAPDVINDGSGREEERGPPGQQREAQDTAVAHGDREVRWGASKEPEVVSVPAFHTNREKLLLYLQIQKLRWLLSRLPITAQQTAKDVAEMLRTLDLYEQLYCCTGSGVVMALGDDAAINATHAHTPTAVGLPTDIATQTARSEKVVVAVVPPLHGMLNFRETPLSTSERVRCFACYCLYVLTFRALPFVLSLCPLAAKRVFLSSLAWRAGSIGTAADGQEGGDPDRIAAVLAYRLHIIYHVAACAIVRALEIDVEMDVPQEHFTVPYAAGEDQEEGTRAEHSDQEGKTKEGSPLDLTPRYLVMNPSHWIEEVGFWACRANPLLLPPSFLPTPCCTPVRAVETTPDGSCTRGGHRDTSDRRTVIGRERSAAAAARKAERAEAESSPGKGTDCSARFALRVLAAPSPSLVARLLHPRRGEDELSTLEGDTSLAPPTVWGNLRHALEPLLLSRPVAHAFPVEYGVYWRAEQHRRALHEAAQLQKLRQHAETLRGSVPDASTQESKVAERQHRQPHVDVAPPPATGVATTRAQSRESLKTPAPSLYHGRSSLGYPLAVDTHALCAATVRGVADGGDEATQADRNGLRRSEADDGVPRFVPVGVAGLPRVLYVDATVARDDSRRRSSSAGIYDLLAADQFRDGTDRKQGGETRRKFQGAPESDAAPVSVEETRAMAAAQRLTALQQQQGFPVLSPLWWGSVYGGSSRGGRATRRVLCYQLGHLSYPEELARGMLEAAERAVEAAYAE